MKIDEEIRVDGTRATLYLFSEGDQFRYQENDAIIGTFSANVLLGVMRRYARPLDLMVDPDSESLPLTDDSRLRSWYYRAPVDLENKLYLVLEERGEGPIAVLARQVSSALRFLATT